MQQPNFFEKERDPQALAAEPLVLHALGDFQSRGLVLAGRELALDRLRGALRRAAEAFGVEELSDEEIAETLSTLGAQVRRIPSFVAKHPYRVTVHAELAAQALQAYQDPSPKSQVPSQKRSS
ncbi:MAG: hypothetical protein JO360_08790 [Acidobacteria bacterium]|nr:hypothetical protein [Acidobacteriota bacterium]